eukprot:scpid70612/ scgid19866/ Uncharacterized protein C15orf26 homolog
MSSAPQAGVRTYNPSVRVGNWSEDVSLEEDTIKDYLEQRASGQLLVQKVHTLNDTILKPIQLSQTADGFVHYGDVVLLQHAASQRAVSAEVKPLDAYQSPALTAPCNVSAGDVIEPCARNAYVIFGCDNNPIGNPLVYNQPFYLKTLSGAGGELFLHSEMATFQKCAKKSREQLVTLVEQPSVETAWKIHCFNPQERLESEGYPVKANRPILINHFQTNKYLAYMQEFSFKTMFGREHEVVAKTILDSHKAETPANHFSLTMRAPSQEETGQQAAGTSASGPEGAEPQPTST